MKTSSQVFAALLILFSAGAATAADSSSGCGLGWEVSQKNSLLSSAIRSTTNAVLPNTFSMTFGTSGCTQHSIVKNESEAEYFVEANFEQLSLDMARGEGEYLYSLAAVMGCDDSSAEFSIRVQGSYSKIFSGTPTPAQVLEGVKSEIRSSPALSKACGVQS